MFFILNTKITGQHSLESTIGWVFFDLIGQHEGRPYNYFYAYSYEVETIYSFHPTMFSENINVGVGHMFHTELDGYNVNSVTHYINLMVSYQLVDAQERNRLDLSLNNYLVLATEGNSRYLRRMFINIKVGYVRKLSRRFDLVIKSPISLRVPYYGHVGWQITPGDWNEVRARAETIGLSVGLKYNFNR